MTALDGILRKLEEAGAKLKIEKIFAAREEIIFLGLQFTRSGVRLAPKYINTVQKAPVPRTIKQLQGFIGLVNWQRTFLRDFSLLVRPLHLAVRQAKESSLKKIWTEEHTKCFEEIKQRLVEVESLGHPDFSCGFVIFSDASNFELGGVLTQTKSSRFSVKSCVVIGYFSRKLTATEENYAIPEKELMAMVETIEHFRPFILGYKIQCHVDQRSILWLLRKSYPSKFYRYQERVSAYSPEVLYIKGQDNPADWMSRFGSVQAEVASLQNTERPLFLEGESLQNVRYLSKELGDAVKEAKRFGVEKVKFQGLVFNTQDFTLSGNLYKYFGRLLVPRQWRAVVIQQVHCKRVDTAHQGLARTLRVLLKDYYWPYIRETVHEVVSGCDVCSRAKTRRIQTVPAHLPIPQRKF